MAAVQDSEDEFIDNKSSKEKILIFRREFRELVRVVYYDDSSDSSFSSDDEDIGILVYHVAFPPKSLGKSRLPWLG